MLMRSRRTAVCEFFLAALHTPLCHPAPAPGRDVKTITGTVCGQPVRVATTHLESHLDGDSKGDFRRARKEQCQQAAALLTLPCFESAGPQDVLLAGDMVS